MRKTWLHLAIATGTLMLVTIGLSVWAIVNGNTGLWFVFFVLSLINGANLGKSIAEYQHER